MLCYSAGNTPNSSCRTRIHSLRVVLILSILSLLSNTIAVSAEQAGTLLVIPPPTDEQCAAPKGPKALHMDIQEARAMMGWGAIPSTHTVAVPGQKIAIIDSGFRGIEKWLDENPNERKYVTVVTGGGSDESSHGYDVYRVARVVLSHAHLLLYKVSSASGLLAAIDDAGRRYASVANLSLGWDSFFEIVAEKRDVIDRLHDLLAKREMFVLFSSGNERQDVHSWISADRDNNGFVDFHLPSQEDKTADDLSLLLRPGANKVYFTWDAEHSPEAAYDLELFTPTGDPLAQARDDPNDEVAGYISLEYTVEEREYAFVRVRQLAGPKDGIFMRLLAKDIAYSTHFNGLQTIGSYAFFESPFVIYVGGVGKTEAGKLAPSAFSDIGMGPDKALLPHVLGPGQLILEGRRIQGTSFASPFITAIYGASQGHNLKNLMELTSSHAPLDPAVPAHERSRWGVPDAMTAIFNLRQVVGPTKIEDVSHRMEADELLVNFSVTRRCMQALTWWVELGLIDVDTGKALEDPETQKPVSGIVLLKSDEPDFARHRAEIRIPLKGLESLKGNIYTLNFRYGVRTWGNRGWVSVDHAEAHHVKLFMPTDNDTALLDIRKRGEVRYSAKDYDGAIVDFSSVIKKSNVDKEKVIAYAGRANAWVKQGNSERALADLDQAIVLSPRYLPAHGQRGDILYGMGEYARAIEAYETILGISPRFTLAYYMRGRCRHALGQLDEALNDYNAALKLSPSLKDRIEPLIRQIQQE